MNLKKYYDVDLFDQLINDLFVDNFKPITYKSKIKQIVYDVIENDKEYLLEIPLAGIKKEDIKVNVEKQMLNISAERIENNEINYNRKETFFGKYEKSFKLPEDVDKENITANSVDGILKIIIPKLEQKTNNIKVIDIQ
jgi:HSP20 family protein